MNIAKEVELAKQYLGGDMPGTLELGSRLCSFI